MLLICTLSPPSCLSNFAYLFKFNTTYNTLITYNRELHSLRNIMIMLSNYYLQDLHTRYITLFMIQHNFNKNNKQALQYSANNKKTRRGPEELITKDNCIKTICTKTYLFVQQHYLETVMISSLIHLNKEKKITRCFKVR